MIGQTETFTLLPVPLRRVLHRINRDLWVSGKVDSEVNGIAFHMHVKGDSAVITFNSLTDAVRLLRSFARSCKHADDRKALLIFLRDDLKLTVYLQSRKFGIFGPHANFLISKIFSLMLQIPSRLR